MSNNIESAEELFDGVVDLIGSIVSSFNKNVFPETTFVLINNLLEFTKINKIILNLHGVELQLLESLSDLEEALQNLVGNQTLIKSKDFVTARKLFKALLIDKFLLLLQPKEKGLPSPSTVWKKSFNKLVKILT